MDTDTKIKFSDKEKDEIQKIRLEIQKKQQEFNDYIEQLKVEHNLDKTRLCILTYKKAIEVKNDKRKFLEPRHYELKEFTCLAFITWKLNKNSDGLDVYFNSVLSNNKMGREIDLYRLEDISYEVLDDFSVEKAKELLKNIKKEIKK